MKQITFYRGSVFSGKVQETPSGTVLYVDGATQADIVYRPYTANYLDAASKTFFVTATRRRYKTLNAACAAVVEHDKNKEKA